MSKYMLKSEHGHRKKRKKTGKKKYVFTAARKRALAHARAVKKKKR